MPSCPRVHAVAPAVARAFERELPHLVNDARWGGTSRATTIGGRAADLVEWNEGLETFLPEPLQRRLEACSDRKMTGVLRAGLILAAKRL